MTITKSTLDSTPDHGQADCRCPDDRCICKHHPAGEICWCTRSLDAEVERLIAGTRVIDGGVTDLGTFIETDDSPEIRIACKAVYDEECATLTLYRDSEIHILDDVIPEIGPLDADAQACMARRCFERVVFDGASGNMKFTVDLTHALSFVDDQVQHPDWCVNDGDCFAKHTSALVEHSAPKETLWTNGLKVDANLEFAVQYTDYSADPDPTFMPSITIEEPDRSSFYLHAQPDDLRTLGQFLITQADRFESMMQEVEVSA